ncbi:hypothetical protein [Amaricoccus sp.]|uniref:hypothetical protein n=1 Tax=Amaricoccus sp. TaxID=1872485 RepID=UPI001B4CE337|nr:hypothetical protein [Amaricoccus sp.]MBP7003240.1 hypothetical protein [Amaricoccus sp.]
MELDSGEATGPGWRRIFDGVVAGLMILAAFVAIGASDVSFAASQPYWLGLAVAYGVASAAIEWVHRRGDFSLGRLAPRWALHWLGVLAALEAVFVFIDAGRFAGAGVGLMNGAILALGTFLAGVHGNWRLVVVGIAVGIAAMLVALVEQYIWLLLGLGILAVAVVVAVAHLRRG